MRATVTIQRCGSAVVIKAGRYCESVDATFLGPAGLADAVRWILVTGRLSLPQESVDGILREAGLIEVESLDWDRARLA